MVLSDLKIGQIGFVQSLNIENKKRKMHLLEMGLTKGTKIKVQKIAPFGKTISIEIRGYELCINKDDASKILLSTRSNL